MSANILTPSANLKLVAKGIKVSGAKRFTVDTASLKEANIGFMSDDFNQHFFGKVEEDIEDSILAVHRLEKPSMNAQIRKELGQEREEIALTHFFDLLKNEWKGKGSYLLFNCYANIAYIRNKIENLWVVDARWIPKFNYWYVSAYSVDNLFGLAYNPFGWYTGSQVFSRDC